MIHTLLTSEGRHTHSHGGGTIKEIYATGHRKFIWPKGLRHFEKAGSKTCINNSSNVLMSEINLLC